MDKITIEQLAEKVRQMREAQKVFTSRHTGMKDMLRLQHQVDEMLKGIAEPPKEVARQADIFNY